ncbi:MAG: O-antigen ligase, partial [Lysobacterales bacterium]
MTATKQLQNKILLFVFTLFLCFYVGKMIAVMPTSLPFVIIGSVTLFLIGFFNRNLAIMILIGSMLLSPEITVAEFPSRNVTIRIEDLLILILFFAWLTRTALIKTSIVFPMTPLNRLIGFYCFAFTFVTLRGIFLNYVSPLHGTFYVLKFLEYYMIYFIVCSALKNKIQVKKYIKVFLATYFIVTIYAILQIGTVGRVSAPFEGDGEPNTLGGYMVFVQAIILGITLHLQNHKKRLILISLFLLSLLPFIYTFSRSSYMSFIPMYLILIFLNRTKQRNLLIGAMLVAIILSLFFFPQSVKERLAHTFNPQSTIDAAPQSILGVQFGPSASARIFSWKTMADRWRKNPLFGYGLTGQGFIDGQYIRILVETGVLGLSAFIMLLYGIFRHTLKIYKETTDDLYKGLAIGFLAGHIGMLFHAMSTNTFLLIR